MPGEIVNIADDEAVAFGTLIRYLADTMDAPNPFGMSVPMCRLLGGTILSEMLLTDMIISNAKMKDELGVPLMYPTYRDGISALAETYQ